MRTFYVYILLCSDDSYYVGFTNNITRRFEEHSSGYKSTSYTASRLPVQLVYHETFSNPIIGIAREKQLKKWSRVKKEALIAGHEKVLKALAKKDFLESN